MGSLLFHPAFVAILSKSSMSLSQKPPCLHKGVGSRPKNALNLETFFQSNELGVVENNVNYILRQVAQFSERATISRLGVILANETENLRN